MEMINVESRKQDIDASWQHDKELSECMIRLYENKLWTDIKFRCSDHDDHERIHAHKIVLAARSPVFQAMFYGPFSELNEEIVLDSTKAEIFDSFLRFVYKDEVKLTEELAMSVLETAHLYQVNKLVMYCADFLASCITSENVFDIFSLARGYDVVTLCEACCLFIDQNAEEVIETEGFLKLTEENLRYILKGDTFFADEVAIFKNTEEWAHKKLEDVNVEKSGQNIRKMLGLSFFYLRLPTMTSENLLKCTRRKGYLSAEEYEDLVDFINDNPDTTVKSNSCISRLLTKENLCCIDAEAKDYVSATLSDIKTTFEISVNRDIKLRAVELAEIQLHLHYETQLFCENDVDHTNYIGRDINEFINKYMNKVIRVPSYFSYGVSIFEQKYSQCLPDDVAICIFGQLKVSCQKEKRNLQARNNNGKKDVGNINIKNDRVNINSDNVEEEEEEREEGKEEEVEEDENIVKEYLVYEQNFEFMSTDKSQCVVRLHEPLTFEKSRSPYTLTINMEIRNAKSVHIETTCSSKDYLTSEYGAFIVRNIRGNFAGIKCLCFEHISNRD